MVEHRRGAANLQFGRFAGLIHSFRAPGLYKRLHLLRSADGCGGLVLMSICSASSFHHELLLFFRRALLNLCRVYCQRVFQSKDGSDYSTLDYHRNGKCKDRQEFPLVLVPRQCGEKNQTFLVSTIEYDHNYPCPSIRSIPNTNLWRLVLLSTKTVQYLFRWLHTYFLLPSCFSLYHKCVGRVW